MLAQVCEVGYQKVGSRCFTCHYGRCGVCRRGAAKIGTRCFTCYKHHLVNLPCCIICERGSAKIRGRCLTCYKQHLMSPPCCGVCQQGYAKIGMYCFTCFKIHMTTSRKHNERSGWCWSFAFGTRFVIRENFRGVLVFPCTTQTGLDALKHFLNLSEIRAPVLSLHRFPRCGVCRRGYAKIGTRCVTCYKAHLLDWTARHRPEIGAE